MAVLFESLKIHVHVHKISEHNIYYYYYQLKAKTVTLKYNRKRTHVHDLATVFRAQFQQSHQRDLATLQTRHSCSSPI